VDKVKWILRVVSLICIFTPLLYTVIPCMLTGDFLGIFIPPQMRNLMGSAGLGQAGGLNLTFTALGINPSGFRMPQFVGLTFDDSTGVATMKLNITNPLMRQRITINQVSFVVKNGTRLFTVKLKEPVIVEANQTGVLNFSFSSTDPNALKSLVNIVNGVINGVELPAYARDLQVSDLYVDVNGIVIQVSDPTNLIRGLFGGGP